MGPREYASLRERPLPFSKGRGNGRRARAAATLHVHGLQRGRGRVHGLPSLVALRTGHPLSRRGRSRSRDLRDRAPAKDPAEAGRVEHSAAAPAAVDAATPHEVSVFMSGNRLRARRTMPAVASFARRASSRSRAGSCVSSSTSLRTFSRSIGSTVANELLVEHLEHAFEVALRVGTLRDVETRRRRHADRLELPLRDRRHEWRVGLRLPAFDGRRGGGFSAASPPSARERRGELFEPRLLSRVARVAFRVAMVVLARVRSVERIEVGVLALRAESAGAGP